MDNKYIPFAHPCFAQTADGGGTAYVHCIDKKTEVIGPAYEILSKKSLEHYKKLKEKGEVIYIDRIGYEEFMMLSENEIGLRFQMLDEQETKDRFNAFEENELEFMDNNESQKKLPKISGKDTILSRMASWEFSNAQEEEARKAMLEGVPEKKILKYFYPDIGVEEMRIIREKYRKKTS